MISITEKIYSDLSKNLISAIGDTNFFNGSIELDLEDLYSTLRCTLIIYRQESGDPSYPHSKITEIVPVWWEYNTYQQFGSIDNDFNWREFSLYFN